MTRRNIVTVDTGQNIFLNTKNACFSLSVQQTLKSVPQKAKTSLVIAESLANSR